MQFINAIAIVHTMAGMCGMHKLYVWYLMLDVLEVNAPFGANTKNGIKRTSLLLLPFSPILFYLATIIDTWIRVVTLQTTIAKFIPTNLFFGWICEICNSRKLLHTSQVMQKLVFLFTEPGNAIF